MMYDFKNQLFNLVKKNSQSSIDFNMNDYVEDGSLWMQYAVIGNYDDSRKNIKGSI